jgi:hypothetical protein
MRYKGIYRIGDMVIVKSGDDFIMGRVEVVDTTREHLSTIVYIIRCADGRLVGYGEDKIIGLVDTQIKEDKKNMTGFKKR